MLALAVVASLLAVPPVLPDDDAPPVLPDDAPVVEDAVAPEPDVIVVSPPVHEAPPPAEGALPLAEELGGPAIVLPPGSAASVVIVDTPPGLAPLGPRMQAVPQPPWSGAGRFVGGSVALVGGLGLATAAAFEFSDGRDSTRVLISQIPAAVVMLVAGGTMIGTAARDQRRLSEWEAATRIDAKPMGTGLIVGGTTAVALGSMAAIATSIAVDMDLDAPLSIPAGWATAGLGIAGGTAMLIAGISRRVHYGKWRSRITGTPMVAPTRAGATLGFAGQF